MQATENERMMASALCLIGSGLTLLLSKQKFDAKTYLGDLSDVLLGLSSIAYQDDAVLASPLAETPPEE